MPTRDRAKFTKRQGLSDLQWRFLKGEELPDTFDAFILEHDTDNTNEQLWHAHEDAVVAEFAKENPGKRPTLWWTYSAPRSPIGTYPGRHYDGQLPEPRLRLGGIGTVASDVLNYKPCFSFGLPVMWVSEFDVAYYTGVAVDVNGALINPKPSGTFKGVAINPDDPPRFESQSSYLDRLGLLLPGEKRRVKKTDFEPETIEYVS